MTIVCMARSKTSPPPLRVAALESNVELTTLQWVDSPQYIAAPSVEALLDRNVQFWMYTSQ